jgi:hypothetical protein
MRTPLSTRAVTAAEGDGGAVHLEYDRRAQGGGG